MTGRLAIIPDFAVPLPGAVLSPKGTGDSGNVPAASHGFDSISEFAQLVQQIEGESVIPQDAASPINTVPQPKVLLSEDAAASPKSHVVKNTPGPAPVPLLPSIPAARHGARTEPSPVKTEKNAVTFDPGPAIVDIARAAPVVPAAAPFTFQMGGGPKTLDSLRQETKSAALPSFKPEVALSHISAPSEEHVAVGQPSLPRPDQAVPPAPESIPLGVSASGQEPASATLPSEMDAHPAAELAKSSDAVMTPPMHLQSAPAAALRQTKPASPEVKSIRTAPAAAPTDILQTVQPSPFNPQPASPPVTAPDRVSHDTPVVAMPGVQRGAKTEPGPVAVELKIRPQDEPVDRIAPQLRAEPSLNDATAAPAPHAVEPTSAPQAAESTSARHVAAPPSTPHAAEPASALHVAESSPGMHGAETLPAAGHTMQTILNTAPAPANPIVAGATSPPVMRDHSAAKPETPPPAATHAVDILPDQPKQPATPLRSISIDFAQDGAQDIHVRLAERGGDVHVSLHSADSAFAGRLADGVQDLVGTLASAGYDAQAWTPGQGHQNPRQQQESRQQSDERNEGSEEFSAMMQEPNEEVS